MKSNGLKRIRMEEGLSRKLAAFQCGISNTTFKRIEKGDQNISVYILKKICGGLGIAAWIEDNNVFFTKNNKHEKRNAL